MRSLKISSTVPLKFERETMIVNNSKKKLSFEVSNELEVEKINLISISC